MRRATYASVFRTIFDGLLDREDFEEEEMINAIGLWSTETVDGEQIIASWDFEEDCEQIFVSVREVAEKVGLSRGKVLTICTQIEMPFFGSVKGVCFQISDLVELVGRVASFEDSSEVGVPWKAIGEALERVSREAHWQASHTVPREPNTPSMILGALRTSLFGGRDPDPGGRLRRLGHEIGAVDLARLLIGKGLENGLLAERETVDKEDRLLSTYCFHLQPVRQPEEQD